MAAAMIIFFMVGFLKITGANVYPATIQANKTL